MKTYTEAEAAEMAVRVRAALAEVWPPVWGEVPRVTPSSVGPYIARPFALDLADPVLWMAFDTAGVEMPCWACWLNHLPSVQVACMDGDCAHPEGPSRPPVELLRGVR